MAEEPAWATFLAELEAFLGTRAEMPVAVDELSPREREVLRLVAAGLANDDIAARLSVSVRTIERPAPAL